MQMRKMEKLGITTSALGYGCMRFPMIQMPEGYVVDESISTPSIRYAIDHGVNYIDTAYVYTGQKNEMAVAHALRDGYRDKVYLATKLPTWECKKPEDMERLLDEQLRNLETDHIDFYLLHSLDAESWEKMKSFDALAFLDRAKASGKIRYACFSFHDSYDVFASILNAYDWDMCQLQFNYMDEHNQAGVRGVQLAGEKNIPVVVMEGLLGGKLAKAPDNVQALYDAFPIKRSPVEWAFRWIGSYPQVATILSGMTDPEMTAENMEIMERCTVGAMTEDELALIEQVREAYNSRTKIGCTGCRYCMPCPNGVNIPRTFSVWNSVSLYGRDSSLSGHDAYRQQVEHGNGAEKCIGCGKCEEVCPQKLSIVEKLAEADSDLREFHLR